MAPHSSSSPASNTSRVSTRKRAPKVVGAVAGAVIGGVLGAIVVQKVREQGGTKRLVPAKVPVLAKRAASAMKSLAHDAKAVAKATAVIAADTALDQVKHAAQQFADDVAAGRPPTRPMLRAPDAIDVPDARSTHDATADTPDARTGRTAGRKGAKKAPAIKPRAAKKRAKGSKARATR